ncbi:hypothetical protein BU24DRAFT_228133 [Aaosphaeria arxii CBS 175.79]|uniref:Azaphilone pigments biosynthesis cluster protein L N-terminal domain-containing protein n=1 Tax=Aaosphaeria arxii CBS 175.79 TaxID=1450172 RepID=A0A6A5XQ82_9PLEO|nr:uncharacterized protein BU24DRAFT_228133 [Aaosphaeria arxii CBS 175.79]KAF2015093.1 hypothetical protein BU24DRAFT_228133 [Aaosphaeria arxii CBS 175.79]
MADPLNVAAGAITIVSLAYSSSRALYELISTIHGSPSVFKDLSEEVITLNQILDTLRATLGDHASMMGNKQIAYLEAVDRTLQGCDIACQDFKTKLEKLTENSSDGKRSFRDGLKLSFQRKNINDFRMRIASWKASLTLGLYVATL